MPKQPNEVWAGDITFIPLAAGEWCYLSVWMDLFSRRIIGWQLDDNMEETLITAAFKKHWQLEKYTRVLSFIQTEGASMQATSSER